MDTRTWFSTAAAGFGRVLVGIDDAQLDSHGLGDWDVRALLGHACRAFTTVETYLAEARLAPPAVALRDPAGYFRAARAGLADPVQVTQRGRDAGIALGDHPRAAAQTIVTRVADLITQTSDDALVTTPVGGMRLADYLPTRAFEATVHGIDLVRATGQAAPDELLDALEPTLALIRDLADPHQRLALLLAATGRQPLAEGFTVL